MRLSKSLQTTITIALNCTAKIVSCYNDMMKNELNHFANIPREIMGMRSHTMMEEEHMDQGTTMVVEEKIILHNNISSRMVKEEEVISIRNSNMAAAISTHNSHIPVAAISIRCRNMAPAMIRSRIKMQATTMMVDSMVVILHNSIRIMDHRRMTTTRIRGTNNSSFHRNSSMISTVVFLRRKIPTLKVLLLLFKIHTLKDLLLNNNYNSNIIKVHHRRLNSSIIHKARRRSPTMVLPIRAAFLLSNNSNSMDPVIGRLFKGETVEVEEAVDLLLLEEEVAVVEEVAVSTIVIVVERGRINHF